MTNRDFSDPRATEQRNPRTERIDVASSLEIVDLMNAEDATIAKVVHGERERIAAAIDLIVAAFRAGGRLVYVGAGTTRPPRGLRATQRPPPFYVAPALGGGGVARGGPAPGEKGRGGGGGREARGGGG